MFEILAIPYLAGMPLAGGIYHWLFRNLPHDTDLDIFDHDTSNLHGFVVAVLFVLFWPVVALAAICWIILEAIR